LRKNTATRHFEERSDEKSLFFLVFSEEGLLASLEMTARVAFFGKL
jgi:hypothetical protein